MDLKKFMKETPVVDMHFDLLMDLSAKKLRGETDIIKNHHMSNFRKGNINIIIAAVFLEDIYLPDKALHEALDQIAYFSEELVKNNEIHLCLSYEDIDYCLKNKKTGIFISLEGAEPIMNDIYLLDIFYQLGTRFLGITWSRRNYAGDGCKFGISDKNYGGGLTEFGIELIKKCEKIGIIPDVSHLNDKGLKDVLKYTAKPFIASHSNSRKLIDISRNLSDKQIEKIAKRGGIIGVNGYNRFYCPENKPDMDYFAANIKNIIEAGGEDCIGIGLDIMDHLGENENQSGIIKNHSEMGVIAEGLFQRGFKEELIKKILGGNFLSFYKKVL